MKFGCTPVGRKMRRAGADGALGAGRRRYMAVGIMSNAEARTK